MAITAVQYRIYRNNVVIASGVMQGSTQIGYQPPDALAANYRVVFSVLGRSGSQLGYIDQRSVAVVGYRR